MRKVLDLFARRYKHITISIQNVADRPAIHLSGDQVRVTALGVVLIMGAFFITGHPLFPAFLILDFYIRAFTSLNYSPLSWLALRIVRIIGPEPVWISKGPKIFAARLGFLLSLIITLTYLLSMPLLAGVIGGTLVLFAFLECGLNFCAGCWVYTYVVYPLVRK